MLRDRWRLDLMPLSLSFAPLLFEILDIHSSSSLPVCRAVGSAGVEEGFIKHVAAKSAACAALSDCAERSVPMERIDGGASFDAFGLLLRPIISKSISLSDNERESLPGREF